MALKLKSIQCRIGLYNIIPKSRINQKVKSSQTFLTAINYAILIGV